MVVRCVYEKVDLYKVSVPTPQITWDPEREIKLKVQCYSKMLQKINRFFDSVAGRLSSVNIDGLAVEKIEDCQQRIIELLKRAEDEKSLVVNELNDLYVKTQPVSYLPLNGVYGLFRSWLSTGILNLRNLRSSSFHLKKILPGLLLSI